MEAIDLLLTRRSIPARFMVGPGPSEAELQRIISAGIRVPDHGKLGPWRIQVVSKAGQQALGDLVARLFVEREGERANEKMVEAERARPQRAPVLLVVTARIQVPHNIPELEQRLSGGALCMNILNAAHALGYCGNWLTEWPAFHEEVKRALGHGPETDIIGFIYIGNAEGPPQERPRPDYADVVSAWDGPAA